MTDREITVGRNVVGWRYGVIEVRDGREYNIRRRWIPKIPNLCQAWIDRKWRRLPNTDLRIYYNLPLSSPGFLVLAYALSGRNGTLATLRMGLRVLDEVGKLHRVQAIVCHATEPKLTEKVMEYFGYVRHAPQLKGHHYIKRLIDRE